MLHVYMVVDALVHHMVGQVRIDDAMQNAAGGLRSCILQSSTCLVAAVCLQAEPRLLRHGGRPCASAPTASAHSSQPAMPGNEPMPRSGSTSAALSRRRRGSRQGPKSLDGGKLTLGGQSCRVLLYALLLLWQLVAVTATVEARVGLNEHRVSPGATDFSTSGNGWAKHGVSRNPAHTLIYPTANTRKRAFRRALHRASQHPQRETWYKGRLLRLGENGARNFIKVADTQNRRPKARDKDRLAQRLRLVTWNCGGLTEIRYRELLQWLDLEYQACKCPDILSIQETHWKQDLEYTTEAVNPGGPEWHVVHSAGGERAGVMCMVRRGVVPPTGIRHVAKIPGRALHIRLQLSVPVNILCTYQVAWNPGKADLPAEGKFEALVRQRRRLWNQIDQWLRSMPCRGGTVIAGDLNVFAVQEEPHCGQGVFPGHGPHRDQADLQEILRTRHCTVLNSWRCRGVQARTYLAPGANHKEQGAQLDYIITKSAMCDDVAKQAGPFGIPKHVATDKHTASAAQIRKQLQHPAVPDMFRQQVRSALCNLPQDVEIDRVLLTGWQQVQGNRHADAAKLGPQQGELPEPEINLRDQLVGMWDLRAKLREVQQTAATREVAPSFGHMFDAWHLAARLQVNRALRRQCRLRKTAKVAEAVLSHLSNRGVAYS